MKSKMLSIHEWFVFFIMVSCFQMIAEPVLAKQNSSNNPNAYTFVIFSVEKSLYSIGDEGVVLTFWEPSCSSCVLQAMVDSHTVLLDHDGNAVGLGMLRVGGKYKARSIRFSDSAIDHIKTITLAEDWKQ